MFLYQGPLTGLTIHKDQRDVALRVLTDAIGNFPGQGLLRDSGEDYLHGGMRLLINGQHEAAAPGW